jgi:hypothetical protein
VKRAGEEEEKDNNDACEKSLVLKMIRENINYME